MLKEGVPRHEQISNWVRQQIESGSYRIDEKLPSENEFAEKFGVSRVTVRRALQTLENERRIYRRQGLGSFVKDNRPHQSMVRLTDFVEDMKRAGMEASSSVIQLKPVPAPEHIASILKIEPGDTLIRLDRLRRGDNQPIAFDCTWLPMFYGQLIENFDLEENTIYRILEQEYDIPVEKGRYRIKAKNADAYLAEYLDVSEGQALLLIDRLSLTMGEKPIYYQQRYYRTDRIVYELMLEREQSSEAKGGPMPLKEFLPIFSSSHKA
ncbi:MAG TPA: GntR family transcriptional regulator [Fodinibius sp.]|nr:GntR family transcriptional regulator [Fodinibius sp.]